MEIIPDDRDAYTLLGACFAMMEKYEKAIICYDKALKCVSRFINLFLKLFGGFPPYFPKVPDEELLCKINSAKGIALLRIGKPDEAICCFNKALEINPKETIALEYKGIALVELRKGSE